LKKLLVKDIWKTYWQEWLNIDVISVLIHPIFCVSDATAEASRDRQEVAGHRASGCTQDEAC